MRILITNDDGLHFPGLTTLANRLRENHDVYIAAPSTEKSGTSSALTIYDDVFTEIIDGKTIMVEGFPVDCVNIALHAEVFKEKFDLVVSGINKGVNMGDDIIYSGTVGAARHAFIHSHSALAVSCGYLTNNDNFENVADFTARFIQKFNFDAQNPVLLNINYPPVTPEKVPGKEHLFLHPEIKWTKMGRRKYRDTYKRSELQGGGVYFNLGGSELGFHLDPGTDFHAYENGFISITPLQLDATDHGKHTNLKSVTVEL